MVLCIVNSPIALIVAISICPSSFIWRESTECRVIAFTRSRTDSRSVSLSALRTIVVDRYGESYSIDRGASSAGLSVYMPKSFLTK